MVDVPPAQAASCAVTAATSRRAASAGAAVRAQPLTPEPLDPLLTSIQPGGGLCMSLELAWGRFRRWYLKSFRPGYVARMRALRQGETNGCPHEVLDPRDLKFYRNQPNYRWAPEHDPFRWRDRLPLVRAGLAEALLITLCCCALAALFGLVHWVLAVPPLAVALLVLWFFRNPVRVTPSEAGLVVAPADGLVVSVEEVEDDFVGGPAIVIGIFLSVFNVHINRAPVACRVIGLTYRRGKFLNALRAASSRENEQLALRMQEVAPPYRRLVVRQIAGAIARRIVCWAAPGETFGRGEQFGMIKLGSRTELVLPREEGLRILTQPGQKIKAGVSILARFDA